jgi:hypothetical protein
MNNTSRHEQECTHLMFGPLRSPEKWRRLSTYRCGLGSKKTQTLASIATAEYEGLTGRTCDLKPFRPKPAKAKARTKGFRQSMKAEVDERWFQFVPPTPESPDTPPAPGPPDHPAFPKAPPARFEEVVGEGRAMRCVREDESYLTNVMISNRTKISSRNGTL